MACSRFLLGSNSVKVHWMCISLSTLLKKSGIPIIWNLGYCDARDQSIAERLDKISVSVGSKCRVTLFFGYLLSLSFVDMCLLILFVSLWYSRENWRVLETSAVKY
jgi:hypothetical protein